MLRRTIIGVIASAALIAATTGTAFAGQTVVQAIKAQDRIISASPTYKSLKSFKIDSTTAAKNAIPKYLALQKLFDKAASSVASASATPSQKTGQKDWVNGVRMGASGIGYLVTELNAVVRGDKTAVKSAATKAVKLLDAGNALGDKGDKLLGLPNND